MKKFTLICLTAACAPSLLACDLCAVYSAAESRGELGRGVFAGVAEQFTHFGTWQVDGVEVDNTPDERLDSSITQLFLGYNFTERFGVQVNVPLIYRSFRRLVDHDIVNDHESGLGDISLVAHLQILRQESPNSTLAWNLLGGVKLPTGDTSRLLEEVAEHEGQADPDQHEHPSGIHGHDLALGSGSVDGIIGTSVYARWQRFFFTAATQYSIRSEGDYDYEYANDLVWSGGPGWIAILKEHFTLSLQANCTGEHKCQDTFLGQEAEDTGITSVFLGPELIATWGSHLSAEFGVDVPVSIHATALQIVPDWRLRGALTWHF